MARVAIIPNMIIELLMHNHMLSVSQMLKMLKDSGENFNKTSVYRSLDKLIAQGKICKQTFREGEFFYELRDDHHDHAVCTKCEKIIVVKCKNNSKIKIPGFNVDHHHTTLYGLCKRCSK